MTKTPPAEPITVSVVIVSRVRPKTLCLCLEGVARLIYPMFEVVVVADAEGIAAARNLPFASMIKFVPFEEPNISAARNAGIAVAGGSVVAFIDDDAVPEPTWIAHLCAPFSTPEVAASGGYVIGRNGISFQWTARMVGPDGVAEPIAVHPSKPTILDAPMGCAIKTEGTNMAVRRDILVALGGFDPAFRFYLDETDLNMRIARLGQKTAIVPLAQVHHAYAPSIRRKGNRAVQDLTEIGASVAVYLRKHCAQDDRAAAWEAEQEAQRKRLIGQMISGLLEPRDVRRVMETLLTGYDIGQCREITPTKIGDAPAFSRFVSLANGKHKTIGGSVWHKARLMREAAMVARDGTTVSVFAFSRTALFHSVRFYGAGIWLQRGGVFGKSHRGQKVFQVTTMGNRIRAEQSGVDPVRTSTLMDDLSDAISPKES